MNNRNFQNNSTGCKGYVLSKRDLIRFIIVLIVMALLFLLVSFYGSIPLFSKSSGHLDTYTIVEIETRHSGGRGGPSRYSIMQNSEGKTIELRKTYRDNIGRQVEVYTMDNFAYRKNAEMNDLGVAGTVGAPVFAVIAIFSVIILIRYRKRQLN